MAAVAEGADASAVAERGGDKPLTPLSFAAGCVAGATGHLVGHPLDTLKVHAQTGSAEALTLRALYRGCAVPIATAGASTSLVLGAYENIRRGLRRATGVPTADPTPLALVGVAGGGAGLLNSLLACPLSRVKVSQQLRGGALAPTALALWRDGSLYRGFAPIAAFEGSRCIYMVSYVYLKRKLSGSEADDAPISMWARVIAGSSANLINWAVVYPVDVLKSVLQGARPGAAPDGGMLATARKLVADGGYVALYRGFWYTMLRAGPVAGVVLPLFDLTLAAFERLDAARRGRPVGRRKGGGGAAAAPD